MSNPLSLKSMIYQVLLQGCTVSGAGLPPETWTTRWGEYEGNDLSEAAFLDNPFSLVTFYRNVCIFGELCKFRHPVRNFRFLLMFKKAGVVNRVNLDR